VEPSEDGDDAGVSFKDGPPAPGREGGVRREHVSRRAHETSSALYPQCAAKQE